MRRFHDRIVRLGDYIAEYDNVPSHSSDWRNAHIRKIKKLSEGVSLNSMVTVSYIKGHVRNTLHSITELPNQGGE